MIRSIVGVVLLEPPVIITFLERSEKEGKVVIHSSTLVVVDALTILFLARDAARPVYTETR